MADELQLAHSIRLFVENLSLPQSMKIHLYTLLVYVYEKKCEELFITFHMINN